MDSIAEDTPGLETMDDEVALHEAREESSEARRVMAKAAANEHTSPHTKRDPLLHSLLKGKLPRNVRWKAVVELVARLGEAQPHGETDFLFRIGSTQEFFKAPHGSELGTAEISRLRTFLHGARAAGTIKEPDAQERTIVVIDHRSARLFQSPDGSKFDAQSTIKPTDDHGFLRHLIHRKEAHYAGDRVPEETSFYEAIAKALLHAQGIILVGHGTGKSSAVDVLAAYLGEHHMSIAERIIAIDDVDLPALTERQLEELARSYVL